MTVVASGGRAVMSQRLDPVDSLDFFPTPRGTDEGRRRRSFRRKGDGVMNDLAVHPNFSVRVGDDSVEPIDLSPRDRRDLCLEAALRRIPAGRLAREIIEDAVRRGVFPERAARGGRE